MPDQIILGGVELNRNMRWVERTHTQKVAQSSYRAVGGGVVIFYGPLSGGERITLTSGEDYGWNQKSVIDQILALADIPGGMYTLTFHDLTFTVMFRHEEPPAAMFEPLISRINPAATDYYTGTIKLITV